MNPRFRCIHCNRLIFEGQAGWYHSGSLMMLCGSSPLNCADPGEQPQIQII